MPDEPNAQATAHAHYMEVRKGLIDAARESARTFDKAVLAFGAAVFGASVAFLKDVAPKPQSHSLSWLGVSWFCFAAGLLAVILAFLFSQRTCIARIEDAEEKFRNPDAEESEDVWGRWTNRCNVLCVGFLFLGVAAWIVFALINLAR